MGGFCWGSWVVAKMTQNRENCQAGVWAHPSVFVAKDLYEGETEQELTERVKAATPVMVQAGAGLLQKRRAHRFGGRQWHRLGDPRFQGADARLGDKRERLAGAILREGDDGRQGHHRGQESGE